MMVTLGFVGLGKVGTTLALAWNRAGVRVVALHSRQPNTMLTEQVNALWCASPIEVIQHADVTFLSVTDSAIPIVVNQLSRSQYDFSDKVILHCSGALTSESLLPLMEQNAQTGSFHPALPFADPTITLPKLKGSVFVLETSFVQATEICEVLCGLLSVQLAHIPTSMKPLYHVALVYASNYAVTLYAIAERILEQVALSEAERSQILITLLDATLQNIIRQGATEALTGPLVRGDTNTLLTHLETLPTPTLKELYRLLAIETLPLVIKRGVDTSLLADTLIRRSFHDGA